MFPRPRYHGGYGPARYRQHDTQMIAGALASLLDQGSRPWEWFRAPPRPPRRGPRPYPRRPYYYGYRRPEGYGSRFHQRGRPWDWSPYALPRRAYPVAIGDRVPRRYHRDERETRQPRGSNPRGTQRGGPARSAKEPPTPPKTSQAKTDGERTGKAGERTRPTVVTVDESGQEKKWGPLSRASAWKAGSYWEKKGDSTYSSKKVARERR